MAPRKVEPCPHQKGPSRRTVTSLLILFSICLLSNGSGQNASGNVSQPINTESSPAVQNSEDGVWRLVDRATLSDRAELASPQAFQVVELDSEALTRVLANVPMEFSVLAKQTPILISLPMPDGSFGRFQIEESPSMEPALAAQFPEVKSYRGQGVDDATATGRFDWSPNGFHATVLSAAADGTVFITPYTAGDTRNYISFYKNDLKEGFEHPRCEVTEAMQAEAQLLSDFAPSLSVGTSLRTYRLAIATTVEYTTNSVYGGTKASTLTKLNTIVNMINATYEREVSIRFQLVTGQLSIIFDGDPNLDGLTNTSQSTMLNESPGVINAAIGSGAYDIGHAFGLSSAGSSGGVAQLGVVCGANKGRGASRLGIALVTGNFTIDAGLVAHEWGHQFGAGHTFNSTSGNCGGGNRGASTAWEPGSGSSVMSYAGTCSPENIQTQSDSYFVGGTFDQIVTYSSGGGACATATSTGNSPPTVSAGTDYTVPMGTPFTLTATGSDPNGDPLTYSWEQKDLGTASPPMTDDGTRPLFRSRVGTASPARTFPPLANILANTSVIGETLPTTTRSMNFRVTARDNRAAGGGVNSDAMVLNVRGTSGPFVVTAPNTAVSWTGGASQTVTWNVAGTSAAPISCANVKISLSTNGGTTFPIVIAASTPNDGSELIVVPNNATASARIKVEAVGNIFFDVGNSNFTIQQGAAPQYQGFLDAAGCGIITGWAWDVNQPNTVINVDIFDGAAFVISIPANLFREDIVNAGIGNGFHGFSFTVPVSLKNGQTHNIRALFQGTSTELGNSPRQINCSGAAPLYQGYHDGAGCGTIAGWAWDINDPNNPVNVDIYDGASLIATVPAIQFRPDLVTAGIGNGFHGFSFTVPASMKDGQTHSIRVKFPGTSTDLNNTPRNISCSGAAPVFQGTHEVANCSVISGWAWDQNDPNSPINVAIFDGTQLVATVLAIQFRQDLVNAGIGNGYHAFSFIVPASLKNGQPHSIRVRFSGTSTSLASSPRSITCAAGQASTITVDTATTFQTMTGWEATIGGDWRDKPTIAHFWNDAALDMGVEIGVNRIRLPIWSYSEEVTDYHQQYLDGQITYAQANAGRNLAMNDNADPNSLNAAGFIWTEVDYFVDNIVTPIRTRLAAQGETLYVNAMYHGNASLHKTSPAEYAEFVLATYLHLQSKYGWIPNAWTVHLEPNMEGWSATQIANSLVAAGDKLAANGFGANIFMIAADCSNTSTSVAMYDSIIAVPGVSIYLKEIAWHNYQGAGASAQKNHMRDEALSLGIQTGMHEHIGADYIELHEDIVEGGASSWQQFTWTGYTLNDIGGKYVMADAANPQDPVTLSSRAKILRQYFKWVRIGAVRKGASTSNNNFQPLAFRNSNGAYTVIVKAAASGSFTIGALPAGTYRITYATTSVWNQSHPNQTIGAGQNISTSIPGVGVLTVSRI